MSISYRTTDLTKWGAGASTFLGAVAVDNNFWEIVSRIIALEELPGQPAAIDHFEVSGTSFYVHLTDATVLGPYALPIVSLRSRGEWVPGATYSVMDTFTINGGLYLVVVAHTAAGSFDPNATDGLGHDVYSLMIQTPGNALPTGGAIGMVIGKTGSSDYQVGWVWKTATGGVAGQVEIKQSNAQDDRAWGNLPADKVTYAPSTGSGVTGTNVQDAIDEVITLVGEGGGGGGSVVGRQTMYVPATAMTSPNVDGASDGTAVMATSGLILKTKDFDPDTAQTVQFQVTMPKSWDKDVLRFCAVWSHDSGMTAYDVRWEFQSAGLQNNENMTALHWNLIQVDSTATLADVHYITDESGNCFANDGDNNPMTDDITTVCFIVSRQAANGADTLDVPARLHGIQVYYNATAATDDPVTT